MVGCSCFISEKVVLSPYIKLFKLGDFMTIAVKLSRDIVLAAQTMSKALNRSVTGQIEYWAKIGKIAEENPDFHYDFIKNILIAKEESSAGILEPYEFSKDL